MTYKNGFKEYFTMGILFGGGMGMVMALSSGDFSSLFLTTVFAGTAFSVLMYLFSRSTEKKFAALRADIERARTVYCDGSANLE